MIICDDRQTDFSELSYSIPPSISVPDSDLMMSSLTSVTRNDEMKRSEREIYVIFTKEISAILCTFCEYVKCEGYSAFQALT
jgi:hypothetical protein